MASLLNIDIGSSVHGAEPLTRRPCGEQLLIALTVYGSSLVWLFTWSGLPHPLSDETIWTSIRAMCAYLMLRDKAIKPRLAGVVRRFSRAPKVPRPVDRHHNRLREELNRNT